MHCVIRQEIQKIPISKTKTFNHWPFISAEGLTFTPRKDSQKRAREEISAITQVKTILMSSTVRGLVHQYFLPISCTNKHGLHKAASINITYNNKFTFILHKRRKSMQFRLVMARKLGERAHESVWRRPRQAVTLHEFHMHYGLSDHNICWRGIARHRAVIPHAQTLFCIYKILRAKRAGRINTNVFDVQRLCTTKLLIHLIHK